MTRTRKPDKHSTEKKSRKRKQQITAPFIFNIILVKKPHSLRKEPGNSVAVLTGNETLEQMEAVEQGDVVSLFWMGL